MKEIERIKALKRGCETHPGGAANVPVLAGVAAGCDECACNLIEYLSGRPLKTQLEEPSEMMEDAFRDGIGTTDATCELCGRHVFGGYGTIGFGPDELEGLQAKAAQDPDKYVEVQANGVSLGHIDGKQFVIGCPCNRLRRFEDWIWNHRRPIMDYIKARIAELLKAAQKEAKAAGEIDLDERRPL